jgi:CRP/FNR family transcriptional regulator, cyclic AMP receptor protein
MVNPEIFPHYAFFENLSSKQLKAITKFAREVLFESGSMVFNEGENADGLYILLKGSIDLFFTVDVASRPEVRKELHFGVIHPGELFGISALVEPFTLTSSARATKPSVVIKFDGKELLDLCHKDDKLAYTLIQQVARTSMERLNAARLQLATAISTMES